MYDDPNYAVAVDPVTKEQGFVYIGPSKSEEPEADKEVKEVPVVVNTEKSIPKKEVKQQSQTQQYQQQGQQGQHDITATKTDDNNKTGSPSNGDNKKSHSISTSLNFWIMTAGGMVATVGAVLLVLALKKSDSEEEL